MRINRLIIYLGAAILIYILFLLVSAPMHNNISDRFLSRGESFLAQRQYEKAFVEFSKSLKYNKNNSKTRQNLALTKKIVLDITAGQSFFKVHNEELAEKISEAQKKFPHAKAALEYGILNMESGDLQIALIPLNKSVEMDPSYPEAWKFLAKAYQESGKNCPASFKTECQSYFKNKYEQSNKKLHDLDPTVK